MELYGKVTNWGRNKFVLGYDQKSTTNAGWATQVQVNDKEHYKAYPHLNNNAKTGSPGELVTRKPFRPTSVGGGSRLNAGGGGGFGDRGSGVTKFQNLKNREGRIVSHQEFLHRREKGVML